MYSDVILFIFILLGVISFFEKLRWIKDFFRHIKAEFIANQANTKLLWQVFNK